MVGGEVLPSPCSKNSSSATIRLFPSTVGAGQFRATFETHAIGRTHIGSPCSLNRRAYRLSICLSSFFKSFWIFSSIFFLYFLFLLPLNTNFPTCAKRYEMQLSNYYVCVCVCVLVTQSYLTFCNSMDCSPPDSSVHGILQARILDWVAIPFSGGSSQPRDRTWVSCIAGRFFNVWATREALF